MALGRGLRFVGVYDVYQTGLGRLSPGSVFVIGLIYS